MEPRVARALLFAKVLVADGLMMPEEKALLGRVMAALGLSAAEQERVRGLEELELAEAALTALSAEEKRALLDDLSNAALVDGKLSPHELEAVRAIGVALGV